MKEKEPKFEKSIKEEKIESKEKLDIGVVLDKYFKKEELSKRESDMVEKYRKECIEEVKEKSYKFSEIGSSGIGHNIEGFTITASMDLDLRLQKVREYLRKELKINDNDLERLRKLAKLDYETWEAVTFPLRYKTVVDLGSGRYPLWMVHGLCGMQVKKYVAVDLESPDLDREDIKQRAKRSEFVTGDMELESVESDMLEYLLTVKDKSSTVISSGSTRLDEVIRGRKGASYLRFLAHEISRVTSKKGITYHYEYDPLFGNYLEEEGFKRITDEKRDEQASGLWIKLPEEERNKEK